MPNGNSPLPQGPARPRPRPPLKARVNTPSSGLVSRRKPPPRKLSREALREDNKPGVSHDLFDAPPPSSRSAVDLSDMAHSEPPGSAAASSAPPLDLLAHTDTPDLSRSAEDVDFLLGLTGSPGTAATLASPTLADLARKAPSEPPPSPPMRRESESTQPAAHRTTAAKASPGTAPPRAQKKRGGLGFVLVAGAVVAAAVAFGLSSHKAETVGTAPSPVEAERKVAPSEPAAEAPAVEATPTAPTEAAGGNVADSPEPATRAVTANANESAKEKPSAKPSSAAEPKPASNGATEASHVTPSTPKAPITPRPEPAAAGTPFDRGAAASALASAAAQASACRKDGDPSGVANVTLTFAPSGRVTTAKLSGPPFAGTATGGCIASTLRHAKIPPFDGDMVTVSKTIVVQ